MTRFSMLTHSSRNSNSDWRLHCCISALVVFLVALPVMSRLTGLPIDQGIIFSDHPAHLDFAVRLAGNWRECLPHPLYHVALLLLSSGNTKALPGIAATLLSLAVACKFYLSIRIMAPIGDSTPKRSLPAGRVDNVNQDEEGNQPAIVVTQSCPAPEVEMDSQSKRRWLAVGMGVLLMLAMPLPNWWKSGVMLGQPSPNVWHNPTAIFCMPIVLMLFAVAVRSTNSLRRTDNAITGAIFLLCTLAKPNYPLAFAPCCAVMLARQLQIHKGFNPKHWREVLEGGFVMFAPLILMLSIQFSMTFGGDGSDSAGLEIAPFKVWSLYTPNITVSIILGLAFPLLVAGLYPRTLRLDAYLGWAWLTLAFAMVQMITFAESGPRWTYGNFFWGTHFSSAIVFLFSARVLLDAPRDLRRTSCEVVLTMHACSGLRCLVRAALDPIHASSF